MVPAIARIRAEVAGLAPGRWEKRRIMFLQAAIDDSGNEPNQGLFVLAGFVATVENWIEFTREWDTALKKPPGAEYAKFKEAARLRDQFSEEKGWTETSRDERLRELVCITRKYASARFHAAMWHKDFHRYLRSVPARQRMPLTDNPYTLLVGRIVSSASIVMMGTRTHGDCTFIFDSQPGQDDMVQFVWPIFVHAVAHTPLGELEALGLSRPRILSPPKFESDRDWFPLQAADLLAGSIRKTLLGEPFPEPLEDLFKIDGTGFFMDEAEIAQMGAELAQTMETFRAENPNTPLDHFNQATAKRQRKNARRGPKPPGGPRGS